jgi:hypothetical protein
MLDGIMFARLGLGSMEILLLLCALQALFIVLVFSSARSYFEKGRVRGLEEATRELFRGFGSHYQVAGQNEPERVALALNAIKSTTPKAERRGGGITDPYHAQLWVLGDAIGEACWLKGHSAGIRRKAPAEGKIRLDLSLTELLQLSWLAHLGFQHMMPNYRGFEIHRFSGEADARDAALSVSKIENAIPAKERPFADITVQLQNRQTMISEWWQTKHGRLTA